MQEGRQVMKQRNRAEKVILLFIIINFMRSKIVINLNQKSVLVSGEIGSNRDLSFSLTVFTFLETR